MIGGEVLEAIASAFSRMIFGMIGKWVVKLMMFFGIGIASYKAMIEPLLQWIRSAWLGMPGELAQWIGALGIDIALTMVLSAYLARFGMKISLAFKPNE